MSLVRGGPPRPTVEPEPAPAIEWDRHHFAYLQYDGAEYPPRSEATDDPYRVVVWVGPVPPTIGGAYARDNMDVWWKTVS